MKKYDTPELKAKHMEFVHPHNSFLFMAANYGIVGVISLCWIFFIYLKSAWRHRDTLMGFSILSFGLIVLIGSFTDTQILQIHTAILFALFTGLQKVSAVP
jgi:O-antigen ligase